MPLAADLRPGMRIAVYARRARCSDSDRSADRHVAAEVLAATRRRNGSVFIKLRYLEPWSGSGHGIFPGHQRVELLTDHYGVCHRCGDLAPCRDELSERHIRLEVSSADPILEIERHYGSPSAIPANAKVKKP